jgi:hypothetical protein
MGIDVVVVDLPLRILVLFREDLIDLSVGSPPEEPSRAAA